MSSTCSASSILQILSTISVLGPAWKVMGILATIHRLGSLQNLRHRSVASQGVRLPILTPFGESRQRTAENCHSKRIMTLSRIHQVVYCNKTYLVWLVICRQKCTLNLRLLSMRTSPCCHSDLSVTIRLHKRAASRVLTAPVSSATSATFAAVRLAMVSRALCSAPPAGENITDVVIRTL
jgi:hypothetical protein